MNKNTVVHENPDFAAVDAAMKRAAKAAHSLARKTKTPCYIWEDGAIVDLQQSTRAKKTPDAPKG
jgi:hypothetical protein